MLLQTVVTKHKFVYPTHSEANKLKCQSLEQRKGYCRTKQGEGVAHARKNPQLPDGFQGEVFIGKIWGEGCRMCDFLLTAWW